MAIRVDPIWYYSSLEAGRSNGPGCIATPSRWRGFAQEGLINYQRESPTAIEGDGGLHENFVSGVTCS